ncbi:MAG: MBL fold metallo-hydrolase [Rubrivivax sp.]|nr:MBL fold metallo-hydrolase [Rubrivivax sp.]
MLMFNFRRPPQLPATWSLRRWAVAGWIALGLAQGAAAQTERPVAQRVAPEVYLVQGLSALGSSANRNFISNASFVVTRDSVVVFDALGSPALAEELLAEIARITPKRVSHVIVTHYHADHIYGLQTFKAAGATIVAQRDARLYLNSDTAQLRLQASRQELAPAIDENTRLVAADLWIEAPTRLTVGGVDLDLRPAGPAHTPEDLLVWLPQQRVLVAGDLVFRGRVPFVGQADSGRWIEALDLLLSYEAQLILPGHGPASQSAKADLQLTRDYLAYLRRTMGEAARNMDPFEEAYARTDWSRFAHLPLFAVANRINAYNTYLLMERSGP